MIDLTKYCIFKYNTISDALKKIDSNKKGFVVVINDEKTLLGTLSDGDIRRAFLKGITIKEYIEKIMQNNCEYLKENAPFDEVCEKFKSDKINFLPVVNDKMRLINILTKKQFHIMLIEDKKFDLSYDFSIFDDTTLEHEIYNRPWGFYKSTLLSSHAQSKIITIFPNGELSLQEHKKRDEHWVVIKGTGRAIVGESLIDIYPGKYIFIPKGCKHQIINNSNENIIFSEVQLGDYFGEDDIIRYKDKYGRVK